MAIGPFEKKGNFCVFYFILYFAHATTTPPGGISSFPNGFSILKYFVFSFEQFLPLRHFFRSFVKMQMQPMGLEMVRERVYNSTAEKTRRNFFFCCFLLLLLLCAEPHPRRRLLLPYRLVGGGFLPFFAPAILIYTCCYYLRKGEALSNAEHDVAEGILLRKKRNCIQITRCVALLCALSSRLVL